MGSDLGALQNDNIIRQQRMSNVLYNLINQVLELSPIEEIQVLFLGKPLVLSLYICLL